MCIRTFFVTTSFLLTMKVSIIVPVFRTERTLTRCVESLQAQTFTQWELILVDDGSDDGAPALCDRMAATDARIRVIHQVNAGLSAARNAGLKVAQGKYVWFVDSDDYVATDTLAAAVNAMETSAVELSFVEFPVAVKWGHPTQHTVALVAETYTDKWNGGLAQRVTSTVMPVINYIDVKQLIIFVLRRESLKMLSLYCPY